METRRHVLYNTSIADPFLTVARILQEEDGFEPVYWIGFNYDHSVRSVPEAFPGIVYQSYQEAWRGIFSPEIEKRAAEISLDVDLLKALSPYQLQAYTMMNRMDFDRSSFNVMERERHYLHLLRCWLAALEMYKVDLVISSVQPHRVYDYVLYLLCKQRGIPFLSFLNTMAVERVFAVNDIFSIGDIFDADYQRYRQQDLSPDNLPEEIRREYFRVQKDYSVAAPSYMARHKSHAKKLDNPVTRLWRYTKKYFRKKADSDNGNRGVQHSMLKNPGRPLTDGSLSPWWFYRTRLSGVRYQKKLKKLYDSLSTEPVPGEKYIFLPLHYQPEATTSPAGDIYVNQYLMVQTLLKNTPSDYHIYVKEHPQQLQSHTLGFTSRIPEFYQDLAACDRVRLMPLSWDSYRIMKDAAAVATVTGTVGWETIMHHIPVLVFGLTWYERCPGVLRITDEASAATIPAFIEGFRFDENALLAYLLSFADHSVCAYHYNGRKKYFSISEEECARRLIQVIKHYLS